jgi:hypothetical protein
MARLVNELCVKLGFCLPPEAIERLVQHSPATVDAFTDDVLRREGMDPLTADSHLRSQIRSVVAKHMNEPDGRGDSAARYR